DELCWCSNEFALRPILLNLLTNAVEYTPVGGAIHVWIQTKNGSDTLRISNAATHLTANDMQHLFDRFWRKDTAGSSTAHSGLGLPLARSLAEFLGLELQAEMSSPNEFTTVLSGAKRATGAVSGGMVV